MRRSISSLIVAGLCSAVLAGSIDPFVPIMWRKGAVDEMASDILQINEKSALRRFFIVGPGFNEVMYAPFSSNLYVRMGREIGEISKRVSHKNIEIGWWCAPSIRYVSDFAGIEDAYGNKSADNKKCPLDPGFQRDWCEKIKSVVSASGVKMVNIEDDYTLAWGRGLKGGACFCRRHLELFSKIHTNALTAAEISQAFNAPSPQNLSVRRAFADTVRESLVTLARKVRASVDEVDPSVRICICEPGYSAETDGASIEPIARAFAGPDTRPAIRPHGSIYGAQTTPSMIPGAIAHTFYTIERLPKDIEMFYEADPYPHNRFFTSASQMGSLMSGSVFAGSQNLQFYCLQYLDDPFEDEGYAKEYIRLKPQLEVVRNFNASRRAKLCGVNVVWSSDALALTRGNGQGRNLQLSEGAFLLAKFGIPYTMCQDAKSPHLLMGNIVDTLSDEKLSSILSGAVIVDAQAAALIAKRGFGNDLGVDVVSLTGRLPVIREEILSLSGIRRRGRDVNAFYIFNAGTEGTVRQFTVLKPRKKTEIWCRFSGVGGEIVTPSLTFAENSRGGRVAVVATSLIGNRSSGLLNLRKQEVFQNLLRKLSPKAGAIPLMALNAPGIWTLASVSEDGKEMMVMVNNLSGDVRDDQQMLIDKSWQAHEVFRIDSNGRLENLGRANEIWRVPVELKQMTPEFFIFRR